MLWIFETDSEGAFVLPNDDLLYNEAIRQGHQVQILELKTSVADCIVGPAVVRCSVKTALYNSLSINQLYPGTICNWASLKCSEYYLYFKGHLLNDDYCLTTVGGISGSRKFLKGYTGFDSIDVFVRPNACNKSFTGFTCDYREVENRLSVYSNLTPQILLLISSAKQVEDLDEYRFVVTNKGGKNTVVAGCCYTYQTKVNTDSQIWKWLQKVIDEVNWSPDSVYTIDVIELDNYYKIVELNSFSCAGLYGCSPEAVVREVSALAEFEYSELFYIPEIPKV